MTKIDTVSEQNVLAKTADYSRWTYRYIQYEGVPHSPRAESKGSITSKYISKRVGSGNWARHCFLLRNSFLLLLLHTFSCYFPDLGMKKNQNF